LINRVDKKGEVTYDRQSGTETELEWNSYYQNERKCQILCQKNE
jgi:hypothetical protein